MWIIFFAVFCALLVLDLGVLHKKSREIGVRESLVYSAFYIAIGMLFGLGVWAGMGADDAKLYWTGYIVEKTLSIDNIFAISLVFAALGIPRLQHHRVLFWGILGSILLRGLMIGLGAEIVSRFHWVLYIFGAFLVFTGVKMLFADDTAEDMSKSKTLAFCRRHLRVTRDLYGNKFLVRHDGKLWLTPLMLALIVVNLVDVVFAVDSVPAILALTTDPFIVFTSNIFAILGLRALYFALEAMLHRFHYLKYALSLVLVFIGSKIFIAHFLPGGKIPPSLSLGITVTILAAGILFSLYKTRRER